MGGDKKAHQTLAELTGLLAAAGVDAWQVRRLRQVSEQLYLIFDQVESQRRVETETYQVTIYLHVAKDGRTWLGESSFTLNPGDDAAAALAQAKERAVLALNPVFALPGPEQAYQSLALVDNSVRDQPREVLWEVRRALARAMTGMESVELASTEIFCQYQESELVNHAGLRGAYAETAVETHFVLLAAVAGEEAESNGVRRARSLRDLQIEDILARYCRYALDNARAELPPSGVYPVIFGEEALDTIFHHLVAQAGGEAAFQGWSRLQVGKPVIQNPRRDLLTMTSDPWLPGGLASRPFDQQGLALRPVTFICDNILQQPLADCRYAAYLGTAPTGGLTNLRVAPGRATLAEMLAAEPVLHLLRFSTLEPNAVTGALSGEIRTGYLHQHGRVLPLKGGSISGNLEEAWRFLTLSRETEQRETYLGPLAMRVEEIDIAGA
ncbi:MAG: metallopeptidase TldD-related protein [Desulfobacca sp.]|uniref:metallopeptidase TldD-related protein n=1 Tax=Desulfobacca sp. TaxID=2067990 RepID=UPI00404A6914